MCSCQGKNRIGFCRVKADKVSEVLSPALAGATPHGDLVLGQFRGEKTESFNGSPYIDQHPFFAPQTRWVLA